MCALNPACGMKERKKERNKASKTRPIETTSALGPIAMRRVRLDPEELPPWLDEGCDFEAIEKNNGPLDLLDEDYCAYDMEYNSAIERTTRRGKSGGMASRAERRRDK